MHVIIFRPEINIRPWEHVLKEIKEGNKKVKWKDREPYAYWKGNPYTTPTRLDFLNCNVSTDHDWNLRLYTQVHTYIHIYMTISISIDSLITFNKMMI